MPRFAANISLLYPELAMVDRIGAAARDGFAAIEVQSPYQVEAAEFRRAAEAAQAQLVLMNAPVGDFAGGERGLAALPGHEKEFDASIERAIDYARATGAPRVHVMAGVPGAEVLHAEALAVYERNIAHACERFAPHGIMTMIEPINPHDFPGYFLNRLPLAVATIERLAAPELALQFDFYHLQIIHGDLLRHLRRHFSVIGHVQIAGVPDRNEPDTGEVNYAAVFSELDRLNYSGWVGCEYRPADPSPGGTSAGLGWLRRL
jgi:2-dehydrotetronate isomerase